MGIILGCELSMISLLVVMINVALTQTKHVYSEGLTLKLPGVSTAKTVFI